MNRDLVFFLAGLGFGMAGGYFLFRAMAPGDPSGEGAVHALPTAVEGSSVGLEDEPEFEELDEAEVAQLEARARADEADATVRTELASRYLAAGRFSDALPWLEEAVAITPQALDARNQLAITYLNMGRLADAVASYEEALALSPDNPSSLYGLGRIKLYVQQDIRGGLSLWERLVAVAPDSVEALSVSDELEALRSAHAGS